MGNLSKIITGQGEIVAVLALAFPELLVRNGEALSENWGDEWLNVVKAPAPPQILNEVLGLGEDLVEVEFAQVYHVEYIVRRADDGHRATRFSAGIATIQTALHADRTLGGVARGLVIGPPNFENHRFAYDAKSSAVVIPVRVTYAGHSPID